MNEEKILQDIEYRELVIPFLEDSKVQSLKNIPHHDSNRFEHSLKVSYLAYKICKRLNLNYRSAAKAGLLHDFYFNRIEECRNLNDKVSLFTNEHPEDAVRNASVLFYLTPLEKDIILTHMWPVSKRMPKHRESFIVNFSDKVYSFKEVGMKWGYNISFMTGTFCLFVINHLFK